MLILIGFFLFGCDNNNISPFTQPENNFAVTCMLDNRKDINLVRVQKIYQRKDDAKKPENLKVILTESFGKSYFLEDTLITGDDRFCYFKIPASFLKRGNYYNLTVKDKESDIKWSECQFHSNPRFNCYNYWLQIGKRYEYECRVEFSKQISDVFLFRLFFEYFDYSESPTKLKLKEIPNYVYIDNLNPNYILELPIWDYRENQVTNIGYTSIQNLSDENMSAFVDLGKDYRYAFNEEPYLFALNNITRNQNRTNIKIRGVLAVLYSIDKKYYEQYMKKTNAQFSVRLDEEIYQSNITGESLKGYGFFGAITTDTIRLPVDAYYIKMFGYSEAN